MWIDRGRLSRGAFGSIALSVGLLWCVAPPGEALSDSSRAFDRLLADYDSVRLALSLDSTEGVADAARSMGATLAHLAEDWAAEAAGVPDARGGEIRALLPELTVAATSLAEADSLSAARDAFYTLSKPLVRWRREVTGEKPVVAYCSMAKRSWLQEEGTLGNPYYGQSMPTCGEVVDS